MPPDVLHFRPLLSPLVQFAPPLLTQAAQENQHSIHKYCQGTKGMNLTKKKLIPILVLILSVISILRLLSLTVNKTSPSSSGIFALSPAPQHSCFPPLSTCNKVASHAPQSSEQPRIPLNNITTLTEKEFKVLSDLISLKSPCNLLIFGFQPQYLILSDMNAAGSTIFLEDDPDKVSKVRINSNRTQICKLEYNMPAKSAYNLLKHARQNPACAPNHTFLQKSKCKLALKKLPSQVYEKNWDVIVVDGPSGDSPESPGRMATIYTAGVLARAGNSSDVLVHDVDRMIEKWFSWEFLCDDNLLHSKGKLWHFRINGHSNSTRFCPAGVSRTIQK